MERDQVDFLNYHMMFKKNYRRGIDRLKAILQSPSQATEFVNNLGGVSVLFNVPVDSPDPNSDKLLLLIQSSPYAENAVQTWMRDFFSFETWDALLSNKANAEKIASNPVLIRALISSPESSDALAASNIAMTAVAASNIAMTAVAASNIAMTAVAASALALNLTLKNSNARTKIANSSYIQDNFDRIVTTTNNSTYFFKSGWVYNDSSNAIPTSNGCSLNSNGAPVQGLFICYKSGSWNNSNSVNYSIQHLQTEINVISMTGVTAGGGYNTADDHTGGISSHRILIGGGTLIQTSGDSYFSGYSVWAK